MQYRRTTLFSLALIGLFAMSGVSAQAPEYDPWEPVNMRVHVFNDFMDRNLLRPVANGYIRYVPQFARKGVNNFFSNINDISVLANNVLQLKLEAAASDTGRLLLNTTLGIGGLFDVASGVGFIKNEEDFGQTLGYWGVPAGPYMVLPLFGPSTLRDSIGFSIDTTTNPLNHRDEIALRNAAFVLQQIDRRVEAIAVESIMSGDPYIFTREAYLQRREYLVNDGQGSGADDWDDWDDWD